MYAKLQKKDEREIKMHKKYIQKIKTSINYAINNPLHTI